MFNPQAHSNPKPFSPNPNLDLLPRRDPTVVADSNVWQDSTDVIESEMDHLKSELETVMGKDAQVDG